MPSMTSPWSGKTWGAKDMAEDTPTTYLGNGVASAIARAAKAQDTVDWTEMGRIAYVACSSSLRHSQDWDNLSWERREAFEAAARAVYQEAARHIVTAAATLPEEPES